MSRSFKRSPFSGWTTATSDKWWKTRDHRILRRRVKLALEQGEEKPLDSRALNPYDAPKDGKTRHDLVPKWVQTWREFYKLWGK